MKKASTICVAITIFLLAYGDQPHAKPKNDSQDFTAPELINETLYNAEKRKSLDTTITALRMINIRLESISAQQEETINRIARELVAYKALHDDHTSRIIKLENENSSLRKQLAELQGEIEKIELQRKLHIQ